jgi:hypothetical protein
MPRTFLISLFLVSALLVKGQNPVGTWEDHLSYYSAKNIAISSMDVYASTGSSIIVYNKEFEQLRKITRVQGLSETGISSIAWSQENNSLVIAYTSTNIDILKGNTVYNIPDISRKYIPGNKEIYRIKTMGKYAYLATSFGIVVVDIIRREIYDTWKPGTSGETPDVFDLSFGNSKVYAATSAGVYYADVTNPGLSYFGNWTLMTNLPVPSGNYNAVFVSRNKVFVNHSEQTATGDTVFSIGAGVSVFSFETGIFNLSIDAYSGGFSISSKGVVKIYNEDGTHIKDISFYNPGYPDISQAVVDGPDIWIADKSLGLVKGTNMTTFQNMTLPGPYANNVISITNVNGKTFITGGGVDNAWNNQWRPLQVFVHDKNSWQSSVAYDKWDAMRVLSDPNNTSHMWVSTWGSGLLEYDNNVLVHKYDDSNSPLQTIIPGKPYSRICGLAMDQNRNIWITQTGVPGSIKILKPDGTWIVNPITIEAPTIGDIIITRLGYKWVILPRGYGVFVLDDNNTPENFTDDRYKQMLIKDTENKVISTVYSISEDLDGNIWVGTDQGPAIYYNPRQVFDNDPRAFRVKVPRNDGTGLADYMLGTEIVTSIAVDGANRKWLGTFSSGAYLLTPDGTTKIINYTEENSPLLSNTVVALAVDQKSGEVWFGTAKGSISVRGDATLGGEEFKNVYSFPNPVRETFQGNVTITGLMRNTQIRITDISGNLVFQTVSDGGQATWNLKTYNGQRVSTGVYLVFCASEDGTKTFITKMLVIK